MYSVHAIYGHCRLYIMDYLKYLLATLLYLQSIVPMNDIIARFPYVYISNIYYNIHRYMLMEYNYIIVFPRVLISFPITISIYYTSAITMTSSNNLLMNSSKITIINIPYISLPSMSFIHIHIYFLNNIFCTTFIILLTVNLLFDVILMFKLLS